MEARRQLALLGGALVLLVAVTVAGHGDVLGQLLTPPPLVGIPLAIAAGIVGVVLVARAADRFGASAGDPRALIRAIRLVILGLAAFAAAAGWLLGSAMPVVAALVIGAVDVIETTALLLVTRPGVPGGAAPAGAVPAGAAPAEDASGSPEAPPAG